MKTRKSLLILYMSAGLLSITACGNGKTASQNGETTPEEVTANIVYTIGDMADLPSLVDVTATYTDADGELQTEPVTSLPWTKSLTEVAMPVQPMLIVSYAIKPGVIYDKPFYTFTRTLNVSVSTTDGRSDAAPSSSTFNVDNSGDELTQHLQQLASKADTLRLEELE